MCNTTTDRNHADPALEKYVTETVMAIVKGFFSSPFSVNHANLQVFFFLLASGLQVMCAHIQESHKCHISVVILAMISESVLDLYTHYSFLSNAIKTQSNTLCSADKPVDLHQAAPVFLQDL